MEHGKDAFGIPVLLSVGLGTFMSALDASVVNAVLPVIREAFHAPVETIQWVVTTCLLIMGGLRLAFGRLGDLRGHKRLYLSGFGVFLPASVPCGVAPTEGSLIAARVLQCVGAAVIVSKCAGHPDRRRAPVPARAGTGAPASAACSFAGKRPLRRRWSICPSSGAAFFRSPWAPPS